MILSILATVAVLAAIAVITAALVLAETVLVYVALGLAGISALLLLGALVRGRSGGDGPDRFGTDGLGKASVHTATAHTAASGTHVEPEHSGRVSAPVSGPARELPGQEHHSWPPPPSPDDSGHEEPEYDVPRWQTPTAHEWPEPDTAAPGPAAPTEEEPFRREIPDGSGWQAPDRASGEWTSDTASEPGTGNGGHAPDASPFSYGVPDGSSGGAVGEDVSGEPFAEASGDRAQEPDRATGEDVSDGSGDRVEEDQAAGEADEAEDTAADPSRPAFSYGVPDGSSGGAVGEDVFDEPFAEASGDRATGEDVSGEPSGETSGDRAEEAGAGTGEADDPETAPFEAVAEAPEPVAAHGAEEDGAARDEDDGEGTGTFGDEGTERPTPFSYRVPVGPPAGEDGSAASEHDPDSGSGDGR